MSFLLIEECAMIRNAVLALAAVCSFATTTRAEMIVCFSQVGSNVVATGSGTINTSGLLGPFGPIDEPSASYNARVIADLPTVILGPEPGEAYHGTISGPSNFGSGIFASASSDTGNYVGLLYEANDINVPTGYVSGTALSDTATWNDTTLSTLGLTPGTYTYTWGSGSNADSFVVEIASIPEPSSMILLVLAIGVVTFGAWLRRRLRRLGPTAV